MVIHGSRPCIQYKSPTGLVFDLTHTGWAGAVKDVVPAKETAPAR